MTGWSDLLRPPRQVDDGSSPRRRIVVSIYDDALNRHYAGGGPVVVQRIAESLTKSHEVFVVTGGSRRSRPCKRYGATYLPLPLGWAGPRLGQVLYTLLLQLVVRMAVFDLWIESFTPPFSSSFLPVATPKPVIGLAQALSGRDMSRHYHMPVFMVLERRALRSYSDVVVLNDYDGAQVKSSSPGTRIHRIPNVTEINLTEAVDPPLQTYALFLGRIDFHRKGLELLLDAHRQVADTALPLVIAGNGRKSETKRLQHALAGAGPKIRWVGHVNGAAKASLIANAAFMVVPSREESFCLVALEALAQGRPVVHFDLPQLSWVPDDCGVAVPRFDTSLFAAAMLLMSVDEERRAQAGRHGRSFAEAYVESEPRDAYLRLVTEVLTHQVPISDVHAQVRSEPS